MLNWLGMFAPAGTPHAVVEKLCREQLTILRAAEAGSETPIHLNHR
jgi:hypothetical protein